MDERDRTALDGFVADLRALHGDALLAVLLTGEAASTGYRPRQTPLSTLVVLADVTPESLRRTRPKLRAWARKRIPTPLFMDPMYLESALDVFPLEFLELGDHHALLHGDTDPLADLRIDAAHLRIEVEEQMRGKMLHLWEAYLESGGAKRSLRRILLETPPGFEVILRGLLRLRSETARPDGPDELLAAVEAGFETPLPVFRRLERVRRGQATLAGGELDAVFEGYLAEVRALVRLTDAL